MRCSSVNTRNRSTRTPSKRRKMTCSLIPSTVCKSLLLDDGENLMVSLRNAVRASVGRCKRLAFASALVLGCTALASFSCAAARAEPPRLPASAPVSPKMLRYAERIIRKYDRNQDGQLEPDEWA